MHTARVIFSFTAILACSLISCASVTESKSSQSLQKPQPNLKADNSPDPAIILKEVINRQKSLQVCKFEFDPKAAQEWSKVYTGDQGKHLVQLLCFMAAYQGAFTFLQVDSNQPELKIEPLGLELAGFPDFDPKTKILSNAYKLTGAGSCVQETQYYWNNDQLTLISSEVKDQVPNGCQELGARSPSDDQLITTENVGVAKLGMTLGELQQILGDNATFEPAPLGVDAGTGIKVNQDGNVQYFLGFAEGDQLPSTNSQITMITVVNPNYRTKEGIGPGTPLKAAVAAYGKATIAYNLNNEAREYIKFAQGLSTNPGVLIRSNQGTLTDFAGIYPDPQSEFNQTQNYHNHAAIGSITINQ